MEVQCVYKEEEVRSRGSLTECKVTVAMTMSASPPTASSTTSSEYMEIIIMDRLESRSIAWCVGSEFHGVCGGFGDFPIFFLLHSS